jgi:hypothetical protein
MQTFTESGKNGREWTVNEKYSNQDFTDADFTEVDPIEFSNMVIINSSFAQNQRNGETPPYQVFPSGIENSRFISSNLDNVAITADMDISDDGWNRNSNRLIEAEV